VAFERSAPPDTAVRQRLDEKLDAIREDANVFSNKNRLDLPKNIGPCVLFFVILPADR